MSTQAITTRTYTVSQAAAILGVSKAHLWRMVRDEKMPAITLGTDCIRIRKSTIERLLADPEPTPIETPQQRLHVAGQSRR